MTEQPRMTCPRCGRQNVAARMLRTPRVNAGKPIPPIKVPYPHDRPLGVVEKLGGPKACPYGQTRKANR